MKIKKYWKGLVGLVTPKVEVMRPGLILAQDKHYDEWLDARERETHVQREIDSDIEELVEYLQGRLIEISNEDLNADINYRYWAGRDSEVRDLDSEIQRHLMRLEVRNEKI